jgi:hypothetical protein
MITNTTEKFVEILAEEGKVLRNENSFANRVTAPLTADISAWVEVDKSVEEAYILANTETK